MTASIPKATISKATFIERSRFFFRILCDEVEESQLPKTKSYTEPLSIRISCLPSARQSTTKLTSLCTQVSTRSTEKMDSQKTTIICGFVCIGSEKVADTCPRHEVYDTETIRNEEGLSRASLLERFKTLAAEPNAIILLGTETRTREWLQEQGLIYVCVYPAPQLRRQWCRRQRRTGPDGEDEEMLLNWNWNKYILDVKLDFAGETSTGCFELGSEEYLEDRMPEILLWFDEKVFPQEEAK